jgi:hypothetical protein
MYKIKLLTKNERGSTLSNPFLIIKVVVVVVVVGDGGVRDGG